MTVSIIDILEIVQIEKYDRQIGTITRRPGYLISQFCRDEQVRVQAGQAVMHTGDPQGDSLYWSIIPGVGNLAGAGNLPASYQSIDPYFWGPLEGGVNAWFTKNIRG